MVSIVKFVTHSIRKVFGGPDPAPVVRRKPEHVHIHNPWSAVEVVPDWSTDSCAAVKQLKEHRFLSSEAPKLPLTGCTAAKCNCHYKHFSDRRRGPRRAGEAGVFVYMESKPENERRVAQGRRSTDG